MRYVFNQNIVAMNKLFSLLFIFTFIFSLNAKLPSEKIELFFDTDIDKLKKSELVSFKMQLEQFADKSNTYFVEIVGHTDSDGNLKYNQDLSERRANFIADILQSFHFKPHQIIVKGMAYKSPIAENSNDVGKSKNRRVEVLFYKNDPVKIKQLGNHKLTTETITINAEQANLLEYSCGIKVNIPANSFTDKDGNLIKGNVDVELTPYNNFKDFILGSAPMSFLNNSNDFFESAGMLNIAANQNNNELKLAPDKNLDFEVPATSVSKNMQLFELPQNESEWGTLSEIPTRNEGLIEQTGYRGKEKYNPRFECNIAKFDRSNFVDTLLLTKSIDKINTPNFIDKNILDFAKKQLEIISTENILNKNKQKFESFEMVYSFSENLNRNKKKNIAFVLPKGKNQSYNEAKYLNNFYLEPTSDVYVGRLNDKILSITPLQQKDNKLNLEIEFENLEKEILSFNIENKHSKKISKKMLSTLLADFNKTQEQRKNKIELYTSKVDNLSKEKETKEKELAEIKKHFDFDTTNDLDFFAKLCLTHKRYEVKNNELLYKKKDLNAGELENWLLKYQNNDIALKNEIEVILLTIKCRNIDFARMNREFFTEEYTYYTTPLQASLNNINYTFRTSGLGMFNVDKLLKLDDNILVKVKRFVNENNETLPIVNLYVINDSFNGVIQYYSSRNYNPYNFLTQEGNNALVAVDIHGNSYKLSADGFAKWLKNSAQKPDLTLQTIKPTESVDLFALN